MCRKHVDATGKTEVMHDFFIQKAPFKNLFTNYQNKKQTILPTGANSLFAVPSKFISHFNNGIKPAGLNLLGFQPATQG